MFSFFNKNKMGFNTFCKNKVGDVGIVVTRNVGTDNEYKEEYSYPVYQLNRLGILIEKLNQSVININNNLQNN